METKYHVREYDDREHIIECQQLELSEFFKNNKLSELKDDLNRLTVEVLSEVPPEKNYKEFIDKLKFLINFGWKLVFQNYKYQISIEITPVFFIKNPLYLKEEYQSLQFRQRNAGLNGSYGAITSLSIEEAVDIYDVLNGFYNEISVISWLELLDEWLYVTEEEGSIWDFLQVDCNPLKSQMFLIRLIESLYLFCHPGFVYNLSFAPAFHLFNCRTTGRDMDINHEEQYNPYFWLEFIFNKKTVDDYIIDLYKLYNPVLEDDLEIVSKKDYFEKGKMIRIIIRTVWINIQCGVISKDCVDVIEVGDSMGAVEDLQSKIESFTNNLFSDTLTNLESLIVKLFKYDWNVLAYEDAIDLMVEQKACDSSIIANLCMSNLKDLELVIKTCYLMLLEIKIKKAKRQI